MGIGSRFAEVLAHPIYTRSTKYIDRDKKGQIDEITTDTWSFCVGHAVFIMAVITIAKVINDNKDLPPDEQVERLIATAALGPLGYALSAAGLGQKDQAVFLTKLYKELRDKILDLANIMP